MIKTFKKGLIGAALAIVVVTALMPRNICSLASMCPVEEVHAQGEEAMQMIMMLLLIMMMSQMLQGKQQERGTDAANNLRNGGNNPKPNPAPNPAPNPGTGTGTGNQPLIIIPFPNGK